MEKNIIEEILKENVTLSIGTIVVLCVRAHACLNGSLILDYILLYNNSLLGDKEMRMRQPKEQQQQPVDRSESKRYSNDKVKNKTRHDKKPTL